MHSSYKLVYTTGCFKINAASGNECSLIFFKNILGEKCEDCDILIKLIVPKWSSFGQEHLVKETHWLTVILNFIS